MPTNRIEGRTAVFAEWAWQTLLVIGVCSAVLGLATAVWPNKSTTVAGTLFGLVLLATAAVQAIVAFGANIPTALRFLEFFSALLAAALAYWCFGSGEWVPLLGMWVGMGWMARGVVLALVAAWSDELAGAGRQEAVGLTTTVVGIAVAVVPFQSIATLSVVVGLFTLALGVSEVLTAVRLERTADQIVGTY
ncbi:Uncharacterized conserved protein [Nocardia otitidiscaviarum]|uniref:Uncharacterized conserved protein n=1 Tax=Nocardia otitidiscaviarum TaxID=1823 RepID=A0A379JJC7_9NOCA|nr:DUF308 domain-containing protein [Nocardia otitidiscaviarum]MBF6180745.1 DUF308 domain-containing protein [Nocardia otitidiscaviarum]SUD48486.1 Uncharacterized conserved protein [Nocardia otitidiscaviarum]